MGERWVSTVFLKGAMFCFYGVFLFYVFFVILPHVLPHYEIEINKKYEKNFDCKLNWINPNSSKRSSKRSAACYVYPENLMGIVIIFTNGVALMRRCFRCSPRSDAALNGDVCSGTAPEATSDISIGEQKPPTFLNKFKNPCWQEPRTTGIKVPVRCLPYFFLIGAPKCGTTDLHTRILKHPQVSDMVKKEIHWFARKRFMAAKPFYKQLPTFANYTYLLRLAAEDVYFNKDVNGYHNKIFCDASVDTLWDSTFAVRFEYATKNEWPMHTIAQNIHHLNPNTKFIAIIRDPIERLYSDYLYFARGKVNNKEHFHYAVQQGIEAMTKCMKGESITECQQTWAVVQEVRLLIGLYHIYLKEYYDMFPRKQILVMRLEDFSNNVTHYMNKVFKHLELDHVSDDVMADIGHTSNTNMRRSEDVKLGGMFPETRKLLEDFYRPHNKKLAQLLGPEFNYNKYNG